MADHFRQLKTNSPSPLNPRFDPDSTPLRHASDIPPPFGKLDGLDYDDFCEAAYEVFFTACRSSPGFGGRSPITYFNEDGGDGNGSGPGSPKPPGVGMAVTSRVKRALGLKMMQRSLSSKRVSSFGANPNPSSPSGSVSSPRAAFTVSSKRASSFGANPNPSSPSGYVSSPRAAFTVAQAGKGKVRRPMTSAEIMRQQMRVTEESDNRLRKTLMRTLVGQMGKRAETIILPLELLRHLKPSEFNDAHEYHLWQKRQLKILEAGLLLHPSIPLEKADTFVMKLKDIIQATETKAIDTGKNSETMKTLVACVGSLAWRSPDGESTDLPHWADGYPLNVHIYVALLFSIFDMKDETLVLDEVDELLELMKKTWPMLGINRPVHNLCFAWVFFEQYVRSGQVEPDLLGASLAMLNEVANDAKKIDREPIYVKMLACVLTTMKTWVEKRLLDYHSNYDRGTVGLMENILPVAFSVKRILQEDVPSCVIVPQEKGDVSEDPIGNMVDHYIRSSLRNEFAKLLEDHKMKATTKIEQQEVSGMLNKLARETEELASKEKDIFSPVLKKWQPIAAGVAAVTLHSCYGALLKKYLTSSSSVINETVLILLRAGKLEKVLVQMMVEESVEREHGGKAIVKEMVPYEVETIILKLLKQWIQDRLLKGKEYLQIAKETETWNPKSKGEPYAQSAVELIRIAREAVDKFFEIPVNVSENLLFDLTDGLEHLFRNYSAFVASCGSKQSYLPTLPPLTRCGNDSKFLKLWKIAGCSVGAEESNHNNVNEANDPHLSTSRGTQRLYIRLNTLHYLLSQLHSLDKTLALSPNVTPSPKTLRRHLNTSYFEFSRSSIQAASQHVSEVAAYRLIFLDSDSVFYTSLYAYNVTNTRIWPALRTLKQNLTLLCAVVTERAQSLILKEVMKASFQAYLMVLLAGGSKRTFNWSDHSMIEEDFNNLKRMFFTCSEGLVSEDVIEREAESVEGAVALMGQSTERLIEDFNIVTCEASGIGGLDSGQKLLMPPTTGKWNRSDPNTVLRVLCYRNDRVANHFLKRTFKLAKRKGGSH